MSSACSSLRVQSHLAARLRLGAGSELGPVRPLLQACLLRCYAHSVNHTITAMGSLVCEAGATVAAVATRRPKRWADLIAFARKSAGKLLVPVLGNQPANDEARRAGPSSRQHLNVRKRLV